jgi:hypothetical protein
MASDMLVKFASNVNQGMKATDAAKAAGYKKRYAENNGGYLTAQARAAGLLMSEDRVREAAELVANRLTNPDDLNAMLDKLIQLAKKGDVPALRTWFERMFGGVPQSVNLNQTGDIRIVFGYEDGVIPGECIEGEVVDE